MERRFQIQVFSPLLDYQLCRLAIAVLHQVDSRS